MLIDIHAYPMLDMLMLMEGSSWDEHFQRLEIKEKLPAVYAYVHRMRSHPRVAPHAMPAENYHKWLVKMNTMEMGVKAKIDIAMLE